MMFLTLICLYIYIYIYGRPTHTNIYAYTHDTYALTYIVHTAWPLEAHHGMLTDSGTPLGAPRNARAS